MCIYEPRVRLCVLLSLALWQSVYLALHIDAILFSRKI